MMFAKALLILSFCVLIVSVLFFTERQQETHQLTVLIMSARRNYAQRQAIRDTWMNSSNNLGVKSIFVLGQPCMLHPDDRIDAYGCEQWDIDVSDAVEQQAWTVRPMRGAVTRPATTELKFTVLHPVVVTEVSLVKECLPKAGGARISLSDRAMQSDILVVDINAAEGNPSGEVIKVTVNQSVHLPKGFEGLLRADVECDDVTYTNSILDCSPLVTCTQEQSLAMPVVGMAFSPADKDSLNNHIAGKAARPTAWNALQQTHHLQLSKERLLHKDIFITDTIDVYRNLPDKLLQALHWVSTRVKSKYILKTDDDCYVNVSKVLAKLTELDESLSTQNLWLGNFRRDWALDDYGKWAEHDYTGVSYPWFACGSGYIISSDIAIWLSANKEHLHRFQGEDVSMGIWLSPLSVNYIHDREFSCELVEKDDIALYATVPELSTETMRTSHDKS